MQHKVRDTPDSINVWFATLLASAALAFAPSAQSQTSPTPPAQPQTQEQLRAGREREIGDFILGLLENSGPLNLRISVDISAAPDLQAELSSYVLRELRQLPNVTVVVQNAYLSIHLVAFQTSSRSHQPTGYAIAVAITKPEALDSDRTLLDAVCASPDQHRMTEERWQKLKSLFVGKESFETLWLRTLGTSDLRDECARIVADFDSQYLEPIRKADQETRDQIKEYRKQHATPPPE